MDDRAQAFQESFVALSRFFVADQSLGESLHQVAELTIKALPQTADVGLTLLVDGKPKTSVFTHPEIPEIDRAQYRTGDGPCLDAYRHGKPFIIESTREPGRWQAFRDSAARHAVHSTMSLPLLCQDTAFGAMNLYSNNERSYGESDRRVGMSFAAQAAFLLGNAQAYWDARLLSESLQQAMISRSTIEQAKGIIMGSMRCDADAAIQLLITQSQAQNVKLRDLAAEIVKNTAT